MPPLSQRIHAKGKDRVEIKDDTMEEDKICPLCGFPKDKDESGQWCICDLTD